MCSGVRWQLCINRRYALEQEFIIISKLYFGLILVVTLGSLFRSRNAPPFFTKVEVWLGGQLSELAMDYS